MTPTPRYRCAVEVGFLPAPKPYVMTRVEQGQEFEFDGRPGNWMEPLNDAAFERVEALVATNKRKTVNAPQAAPTGPVVPPRSGMSASLAALQAQPAIPVRDVAAGAEATTRAPPRRRAAKAE